MEKTKNQEKKEKRDTSLFSLDLNDYDKCAENAGRMFVKSLMQNAYLCFYGV